jgi:hypothetical protein
MPRTRLAALALAASALAGSGCGGAAKPSSQVSQTASSSSSSARAQTPTAPESPSSPSSRSELIARADAICRRVNAKRASITITRPQDIPLDIPPLAAYEEAAVSAMRQLTPPASMANGWKQIVAASQTVADVTTKVGNAAKAGKLESTRSLDGVLTSATEQMLNTAKREGFTDCAQK